MSNQRVLFLSFDVSLGSKVLIFNLDISNLGITCLLGGRPGLSSTSPLGKVIKRFFYPSTLSRCILLLQMEHLQKSHYSYQILCARLQESLLKYCFFGHG